MNELTLEQKAEAYDRALERAKKLYEQGTITESLSYVFPELKESEDERIRKWIKKELESKYVVDNIVNNVMADKALAWIEKQCEQKSKFRVGDTIKNKYDDRQFTIKSVDLDKGAYTYTQEGCGNDIDYADEEFELVEQKPVEWGEEDEVMIESLNNCIDELEEKNGWNYVYVNDKDVKLNDVRKWLKSLKHQKQWKPSKEQMNALDSTLQYSQVSHNSFEYLNSLYNDLKKIREE